MAWKLTANFPQFAQKNQRAVREALRKVAPTIRKLIVDNTSAAPGGHLHDTGYMRETVDVVPIGGANPRIEVHTTDYGIYQDQGFTHAYSGEFIHNPWITPVIKGMRNDILKFLSNQVRGYFDAQGRKRK